MVVADHGREELRGIIGLQVRALEGQLRVAGAVGLAEAEPRERAYPLPQRLRLLGVQPAVFDTPLDELASRLLPLLHWHITLVQAVHRLPDLVRLLVAEPGDMVADLRHILLKRADIVRVFENRFQRRVQIVPVFDPFLHLSVPFDEGAAIGGASRPDQARRNRKLIERLCLRLLVQPRLRRALDIENPLRSPLRDNVLNDGIVIALLQVPHIRIGQRLVFDLLQGVPKHGKGAVPEKVELDETQLVDPVVHVDLRDRPVLLTPRTLQRDMPPDGVVGDQKAARMLPQKPRFSPDLVRQGQNMSDLPIFELPRPRALALHNPGDLLLAVPEDLGRLPEGRPPAKMIGRAGDGHPVFAPFVHHVIDDPIALVPSEIEVGIGRGGAIFVQKSLEVEIVPNGVQIAHPDIVERDGIRGTPP